MTSRLPSAWGRAALILFVSIASHLLAACGSANSTSDTQETWDRSNDPWNLDASYERRLANLPITGSTAITPWSDTYWPDRQGGIANRWAAGTGAPWGQALLSYQQVATLTANQLAGLSPAEKYDIFIGRFDYPVTIGELNRTQPSAPGWAGVCHGWAPAAINYYEPKPVTLTSANGINKFDARILQVRSGASPGAAFGTVQEVEVEATMGYVVETAPNWQQVGGQQATKTYRYRLELAADGAIIGGEWNGADRPDFLWTMAPTNYFQMTGLLAIYQASIGAL